MIVSLDLLRSSSLVALTAITLSAATNLQAQTVKQEDVLRVTTRVVVTDVVVTDKKGNPIHGIPRSAFKITDNDEPQHLTQFEEHSSAAPRVHPMPPLPKGVYTNYPTTNVTDTVAVLLLDALNTSLTDQAYVRHEMIRFLKTIPPGTRVAIFTLASRLRILQGFTTDPDALSQALKNRKGFGSANLALTDTATDVGAAQSADNGLGADATDNAIDVASSLNSFESDMVAFQNVQRREVSMEAMQELGRYLTAIPGRKMLIWFSGSFPISFAASPSDDAIGDLGPEAAAVRRLVNTFAHSQIAVYPVDAKGLVAPQMTSAAHASTGAMTSGATMSSAAITSFQQMATQRQQMENLADQTGGRAYADTNGLKEAVDQAINQGANYYTLLYRPTENPEDGKFHKVVIELPGTNYKLAYRKGYYSDPEDKAYEASAEEVSADAIGGLTPQFLNSMTRGMPDATEIVFDASVRPAKQQPDPATPQYVGQLGKSLKPPVTRWSIDVSTSIRSFAFQKNSDGKSKLTVVLAAVAYTIDGQVLNSDTRSFDVELTQQAYQTMLRTGLQGHIDLDVPARSDAYIRIGVLDPVSGKMGTLELSGRRLAAETTTSHAAPDKK